MELEEILFNGKDENLKRKLDLLPPDFFNLNTMKVDVFLEGNVVELHVNQKSNQWPISIDLPSMAQDVKILSYNGQRFIEFYYKKNNYSIKY